MPDESEKPPEPLRVRLRHAIAAFRVLPSTLRLVFRADLAGAIALAVGTVVGALLPAALAWVAKLIIDGIVLAARTGDASARTHVLWLIALELALMVLSTVGNRLLGLTRELLRVRLGNHLNEQILEKAMRLELRHFEDADTYDKMQNARRESSERPLSLVNQVFSVVQNVITLGAYAALLFQIAPWGAAVIVAASVPAFIAEVQLSRRSFRLYSWRAPEGRRMNYLEWILTRDSHVKETKLFDLGGLILGRYRALYRKFFVEDRALAIRRMGYGVGLGLLSLGAFYACYAAIAGRAARAEITLGDMTLYLTVFRQGQGSFQSILSAIGAMYENALFMTNLFTFLAIPADGELPRVTPPLVAAHGHANSIELRDVSFRYPGRPADQWALRNVSLTLSPGEKLGIVGENGAGKSTLIKLLLRLYDPTEGAILYGGVDLRDMDPAELRARVGAVFQDFVRYQFSAAENVGLGWVPHLGDRARVVEAAKRGGADGVISTLPKGYDTMLGGWFEKGQELSAGQWQKLAVSRAFMRDAEVLILDEPTASIDAEAEHELFERFRDLAADRIAILISHRFSTVRMADRIAVLTGGRLEELGSHAELLARRGRYARLFELQAEGYR